MTKKPYFVVIGWLAVVFCIYVCTIPANRTEAEDAYAYAWQIENHSFQSLIHRHHLLYAPCMRILLAALRTLGCGTRAFELLVAVSLVSSIASLAMFAWICRSRLNASMYLTVAAGSTVAFTYGFWRYAVEAEIYLPAICAALIPICLGLSRQLSTRRAFVCGLLTALSATIHIMNVMVTVPLLALSLVRRRRKFALVYFVTFLVLLTSLYIVCFGIAPDGAPPGDSPSRSAHMSANAQQLESERLFQQITGRLNPVSILRGGVGLGQCLVSGNFLFSYDRARSRLLQMFPSRMLEEEVYLGTRASSISRYLPPVLIALLFASGVYLVSTWVRFKPAGGQSPRDTDRSDPHPVIALSFVLWFLLYAAVILFFEPGNPEMWIMSLLPLYLGMIAYAVRRQSRTLERGLMIIAVLFAAANYSGGMALLQSVDADYNHRKANPVLSYADAADLIVTAGNPVFVRFLRYYTDGEVFDLWERNPEELVAASSNPRRRVLVLGDVLQPPVSLRHRFKERYSRISDFSELISPELQPVYNDEFGGLHVWRNNRNTESAAQHLRHRHLVK